MGEKFCLHQHCMLEGMSFVRKTRHYVTILKRLYYIITVSITNRNKNKYLVNHKIHVVSTTLILSGNRTQHSMTVQSLLHYGLLRKTQIKVSYSPSVNIFTHYVGHVRNVEEKSIIWYRNNVNPFCPLRRTEIDTFECNVDMRGAGSDLLCKINGEIIIIA